MKKIVRIQSRICVGGPAQHTILLSRGLTEKGYDTLLVGGGLEPQEESLVPQAEALGIRTTVVTEMGRGIHPWRDLKALLRLWQIITREKPDIVHTHTAKAGALGRLAAALYNLGSRNGAERAVLIHTFHGHVFSGYFSSVATHIFLGIERLLARFTNVFIAISPLQLTELSAKYRIAPPQQFSLIPLGLDLQRFADLGPFKGKLRSQLGITKGVIIGTVGRLVPIKNHRLFLQAAARLLSLDPSLRATFLVVGDGELRRDLEAYARLLGLSPHIVFTGWRTDLEVVYADMDVAVLTSDNEGTPVGLIEAMASGLPVVATRVGGVPDVVDLACGVLVPPGDAESLARALLTLVGDQRLRRDMGSRGRAKAFQCFDAKFLLHNMDRLYAELLQGRAVS